MYMDYPVQFMISGPDPAVLKRLCGEVEELMNEDSTTMLVTDDARAERGLLSADSSRGEPF